jgi:CRISPR-associated exonuclease Cas4
VTADDAPTGNPVERLLENARNPAEAGSFRVTGVMMQYYTICKRELWFASRNLEIDRDRPAIARGTHVDDTAYGDRRRSVSVDGVIKIDLLDDGSVVEVKPSSSITDGARLQLLYYLWYLEHVVGESREGVLAHPTERKRETVKLDEEAEERVESAIRGIHEIVSKESPPPAERKPFCDSCAYHDLCWS